MNDIEIAELTLLRAFHNRLRVIHQEAGVLSASGHRTMVERELAKLDSDLRDLAVAKAVRADPPPHRTEPQRPAAPAPDPESDLTVPTMLRRLQRAIASGRDMP